MSSYILRYRPTPKKHVCTMCNENTPTVTALSTAYNFYMFCLCRNDYETIKRQCFSVRLLNKKYDYDTDYADICIYGNSSHPCDICNAHPDEGIQIIRIETESEEVADLCFSCMTQLFSRMDKLFRKKGGRRETVNGSTCQTIERTPVLQSTDSEKEVYK